MPMRYGIAINGAETFNAVVDMVCEAEAAGWDGLFLPDGISTGEYPLFDPWVVMGAATDDGGFSKVGEAMDLKVRARRTDESLEIINGLWKGTPYTFAGEHFHVDNMIMIPRPVQTPRIPIWIVGVWNKVKSMRRALAWDGIIPQKFREWQPLSADEIRKISEHVSEHRTAKDPFEIICNGSTSGKNFNRAGEITRPFIDAGGTWWIEADPSLERIRQGPPI